MHPNRRPAVSQRDPASGRPRAPFVHRAGAGSEDRRNQFRRGAQAGSGQTPGGARDPRRRPAAALEGRSGGPAAPRSRAWSTRGWKRSAVRLARPPVRRHRGTRRPAIQSRGEPAGSAVLPADLLDRYHDYLSVTGRAARAGNVEDPEAVRIQDAFTQIRRGADPVVARRPAIRANPSSAPRLPPPSPSLPRSPKSSTICSTRSRIPRNRCAPNAARSLKSLAILARNSRSRGPRSPRSGWWKC